MPILKNAQKALRSSQKKATVNRRVKSQIKTALDALKKAPDQAKLSRAFSVIDRGVKNNTFHKNKAAHLKSQMAALLPSQ